MCRPKTKPPARTTTAVAVALAGMLAGCSGIYMDRRDSIALGSGDAVAANEMAQMYDPWPARSGDVNYGANGQRMQSAVERYRNNLVTPPISPTQLVVANPSPNAAQNPASPNGTPPSGATTTTVAGSSGSSSSTASASGQ
jgi:hypothetical protein